MTTSQPDKGPRIETMRSVASISATTVLVVAGAVVAGATTARLVAPSLHSRYLPWITGRALGMAAYLTLTALMLLGTWMRHPWRFRISFLHGETRLRAHAALAVATLLLVVGHGAALATDHYAGVGWWGALVPGMSHYRTVPVALGVVAFFALLLVAASAGLAGRRGTRHWLAVHRTGATIFVAVWLHGVLAGTDTRALRLFYVATGLACIALVVTRVAAHQSSDGTRGVNARASFGSEAGFTTPVAASSSATRR